MSATAIMLLQRGDLVECVNSKGETHDLAYIENVPMMRGDMCRVMMETVISGRKFTVDYPAEAEVEVWAHVA